MPFDLEAIRKKVSQLNGTLKRSRVNYWKPEPGEYNIRVLPWPNNDGQPFKERWFYYNIGKNPGLLAPTQYQKADPVQELIDKLHASGKKEDKEIAKKLYPKMRAFAPIIVRGPTEDQVLVWSFGKEIYQRLLEFFLDAEIGDITEVNDGFDLKVKITKAPGKFWPDTTVDAARKATKLFPDTKKIEDTLAAIPNLDEYHKLKTYDELKAIIEAWSRGDDQPNDSEGSSRGAGEPDELDKLANEVSSLKTDARHKPEKLEEVKAAAVEKADKAPRGKGKKADDDLEGIVPSKIADSIDSVFDEILDS